MSKNDSSKMENLRLGMTKNECNGCLYCGNDCRGKPVFRALAETDLERKACVPPKVFFMQV